MNIKIVEKVKKHKSIFRKLVYQVGGLTFVEHYHTCILIADRRGEPLWLDGFSLTDQKYINEFINRKYRACIRRPMEDNSIIWVKRNDGCLIMPLLSACIALEDWDFYFRYYKLTEDDFYIFEKPGVLKPLNKFNPPNIMIPSPKTTHPIDFFVKDGEVLLPFSDYGNFVVKLFNYHDNYYCDFMLPREYFKFITYRDDSGFLHLRERNIGEIVKFRLSKLGRMGKILICLS